MFSTLRGDKVRKKQRKLKNSKFKPKTTNIFFLTERTSNIVYLFEKMLCISGAQVLQQMRTIWHKDFYFICVSLKQPQHQSTKDLENLGGNKARDDWSYCNFLLGSKTKFWNQIVHDL